jgi:hypothetical protein
MTETYPPTARTEWEIWKDLTAIPHSDNLRLILADFLEERARTPARAGLLSDEDLAYALRWAIHRGKRPALGEHGHGWEWHTTRGCFDEPDHLPWLVLQAIPAVTCYLATSLPEAYKALARGLRTLKDLWRLIP